MNEFISGAFLLVVELAVFLLIILGVMTYVLRKKNSHIKELVKDLIGKLKTEESGKKDRLIDALKASGDIEEEKVNAVADALIESEKKLYSDVIAVCTGSNVDKLADLSRDVENLIGGYSNVSGGGVINEDEGEQGSRSVVKIRGENKALREDNARLRKDLGAAMNTMESMMSEYASMYEGGKEEGGKRVKNEMFRLKKELEKEVELSEDENEVNTRNDMDSEAEIPEVTDISDEILGDVESEEEKNTDDRPDGNSSTNKEKDNPPANPDR
ncbi:MAG: hypothetical protein OQK73_13315 [Gammaproteobacteria bacterium]|nr:hypothetical protein [Gammaproteobacteria bacterium]